MSRVKLILEIDGVNILQFNQIVENESFEKELIQSVEATKLEFDKSKELIKKFIDNNY
jgi:hypothetical protein